MGSLAAYGIESLTVSPPSLEDLFLRHYDGPNGSNGAGARRFGWLAPRGTRCRSPRVTSERLAGFRPLLKATARQDAHQIAPGSCLPRCSR